MYDGLAEALVLFQVRVTLSAPIDEVRGSGAGKLIERFVEAPDASPLTTGVLKKIGAVHLFLGAPFTIVRLYISVFVADEVPCFFIGAPGEVQSAVSFVLGGGVGKQENTIGGAG